MPYTICPFCLKKSYSAATLKIWLCPYCGEKINESNHKNKEETKFSKEKD